MIAESTSRDADGAVSVVMQTSDFMSGAWGQDDTDMYILTVGRQSRSTFVISTRLPLQHSQGDMVGTRHNHADRAANIRVGPT
jgi:hypothetical protein